MIEFDPEKCPTCPFRDRHIYVVGCQRFDMELLVGFIARNTPAKLFQVERLDAVPASSGSDPLKKKLVLLNCLGWDAAALRRQSETQHWARLDRELIALLHVARQHGIEEEALRLGARGVLYDDDHPNTLLRGICAINSGELWFSRQTLAEALEHQRQPRGAPGPAARLSQREREILALVAAGLANEAIADRLCLSPHTIKTHLYNIYRKIHVKSRVQAARWLQRQS